MKTVAQVSKITGVSVRTLHHYDAIDLLKPTKITPSGYRLYDDAALKRLQSILFFRQLQFSLKEIKEILDTPGFDPIAALSQQIRMLEMQRDHLDALIDHARQIQESGGITMNFAPFDTTELDQYAAQAKEKWGKTEAYKEFKRKTAGAEKELLTASGEHLMDIFRRIGTIRHLAPGCAEAQVLIGELQAFITDHYYTCTKQILKGLGQMYITGDTMTENIEKAGGRGTADFTHQAIEIYCQ